MSSELAKIADLARTYDLSGGNCLNLKYTRLPDGTTRVPSLWDDREGSEPIGQAERRHNTAAKLCAACPCLEACKAYAETCAANGQKINGVIAAHKPKLKPATLCRTCGCELTNQKRDAAQTIPHIMPGCLCLDCYRTRHARPTRRAKGEEVV